MTRYVSRKALRNYLVGSLYWSGAALEDPGRGLARAARWYAALVGMGHEEVPFSVVFDLGHLLLLGPTFPLGVSEWYDRYPAEERAFRVAYGNGYLASLAERPWFTRAYDLVAATEDVDPAVIFALERILEGADGRDTGDLVVQPSRFPQLPWDRVAREVAEGRALEVYREARDAFEAWADEPGFHRGRLEAFLEHERMRGGRGLGEIEFFELENLTLLDTREKRMAARQLKEAELLLPSLGAGALARVPEVEEVDVDVADEGTYPSGGLEGLANHGTWENLLPSELVYLGEEAGGVDLFTLRHVEGELLFYTRDGGHLRRRRRAVHVVLDLDESLTVKFPEHPFRLDRMIEGLATRLVTDVLEAFEKDACMVHLHVRGPEGPERVAMLTLRFAREARRGEVVLEVADEVDPGAWCDPRRKSYCVWIGRVPGVDAGTRTRLEQERMHAFGVQVGSRPAPEDPDWWLRLPTDQGLLDAMVDARERLVEALLGGT